MFAAAPQPPGYACDTLGGTIYEKTSPLNSISFESGYGTPVIRDADSPATNNVTSTKQTVTAASGLLVSAVNRSTFRYSHHFDPLGDPAPPIPRIDGIRAVRRYMRDRAGRVSFGLIDSRRRFHGRSTRRAYVAARVVKAMLVATCAGSAAARRDDESGACSGR